MRSAAPTPLKITSCCHSGSLPPFPLASEAMSPLTPLKQLTTRLRAMPSARAHPPEDSLALRVAVQCLVSVGILATDVAAGTHNALWAIPLSGLGAAWSWKQRRQANTLAKLGIAMGMLAVLSLFLSKLVGQGNDSRLVLAELLIQLQVLHTFDLPRRKDLGYSAVIGLILIAVAATISETSWFGLWLVLFLAIAIPVLLLDYRARLALPIRKLTVPRRTLKPTVALIALVLLLGLGIFALMPRMPGYKLRTFPMSAPIEVKGQFDNQQIINPGYVKPGKQTGKTPSSGGIQSGTGDRPEAGESFTSSRYYYGFNQTINQTTGGPPMIPEVVMRIRTQAPGFWRVMAFDRYTGQGWELSQNEQTETLKRPSWSYQFQIPQEASQAPTREVVQTITLLSDFTNQIPVLQIPRQLYFPTPEIAIDPETGLRSPVQLEEGLTYTAVSDVPLRDRTLLQQADTRNSALIQERYLQLPQALAARLQTQTEALLATADSNPTAASERSLLLAQLLKQRYTLQNLPTLPSGADLVENFLTQGGGTPDQFSTVLTVMLRSIGIPARLATGFAPGRFNPFTGMYVVKNTDAYALTEVYLPKLGWYSFDPIPGHPLVPLSVEDNERFPLLSQIWHWVAGWLPSPLKSGFSSLWLFLGVVLTGVFRWLLGQGWLGAMIAVVGVSAIAGVLRLLWQGWRAWRYRRWLASLDPMEQVYRSMLRWMERHGRPKDTAMTPLEYAQWVENQCPPAVADVITEISRAYMEWHYGGRSPNLQELEQQWRELKQRWSPIDRRSSLQSKR